jgi:hypothetical protein
MNTFELIIVLFCLIYITITTTVTSNNVRETHKRLDKIEQIPGEIRCL